MEREIIIWESKVFAAVAAAQSFQSARQLLKVLFLRLLIFFQSWSFMTTEYFIRSTILTENHGRCFASDITKDVQILWKKRYADRP